MNSAFILITRLISRNFQSGSVGPGGPDGQGGQVVRVVTLDDMLSETHGFHALNNQIIERS